MTTAGLQTLNRIGKRLPCDVAYEQKFRLPQESVGIMDVGTSFYDPMFKPSKWGVR
jgi:hypothetical protein